MSAKSVTFVAVMMKMLQTIWLWLFMLACVQAGGMMFAGNTATQQKSVAFEEQMHESSFLPPQLFTLPEAEVAGQTGGMPTGTVSRLQRFFTSEYLFSLRALSGSLSSVATSRQKNELHRCDAFPHPSLRPACRYYIFTLRRILI
ncbi:MAG: hypothetical protein IJZ86_00395 [Bacteroides sp.]|nr:hypothetical protein [Bacteroides sp.]